MAELAAKALGRVADWLNHELELGTMSGGEAINIPLEPISAAIINMIPKSEYRLLSYIPLLKQAT
ncbi:hypothetical protein ACW4YW_02325 [Methylobacillus pratensis]